MMGIFSNCISGGLESFSGKMVIGNLVVKVEMSLEEFMRLANKFDRSS